MFRVRREHPLIEGMLSPELSSMANAVLFVHALFVRGAEPEPGLCGRARGSGTGTGLQQPKRDAMPLFVWVGQLLSRCLRVASRAEIEAAQL